MRTLIAVAASTLLCTSALACDFHGKDAHAGPDPSIAMKKDPAAPATTAAASGKATTQAAAKPRKDTKVAASTVPKPVYFEQRAAN